MSVMIRAYMVNAVDAFNDSKFKDNAPAFACAVLNSWENTIKQAVGGGGVWRSSRFFCVTPPTYCHSVAAK
jgi:hypothetical protein